MDWRILRFDTLGSTQDFVKERAASGEAEGLLVQADTQESGHGRHGRVWDSPKGNLYLSFLLRPECGAPEVGQLSLLAGVALARAIDRGDDVFLKWPNDVMLRGKKCAGILLESDLGSDGKVASVVIGVGVNIVSAPPEIGACLGGDIDLDAFRDRFLDIFRGLYAQWQAEGFEALRDEWLSLAYPQGQSMSVKIAERLESGLFHDIDAFGNLRLVKDDGSVQTIHSGDVYVTGD